MRSQGVDMTYWLSNNSPPQHHMDHILRRDTLQLYLFLSVIKVICSAGSGRSPPSVAKGSRPWDSGCFFPHCLLFLFLTNPRGLLRLTNVAHFRCSQGPHCWHWENARTNDYHLTRINQTRLIKASQQKMRATTSILKDSLPGFILANWRKFRQDGLRKRN